MSELEVTFQGQTIRRHILIFELKVNFRGRHFRVNLGSVLGQLPLNSYVLRIFEN